MENFRHRQIVRAVLYVSARRFTFVLILSVTRLTKNSFGGRQRSCLVLRPKIRLDYTPGLDKKRNGCVRFDRVQGSGDRLPAIYADYVERVQRKKRGIEIGYGSRDENRPARIAASFLRARQWRQPYGQERPKSYCFRRGSNSSGSTFCGVRFQRFFDSDDDNWVRTEEQSPTRMSLGKWRKCGRPSCQTEKRRLQRVSKYGIFITRSFKKREGYG